ncbi:Fe-S cluster assembly protein SufD [Methylocapsa sp. S129]|uniref:Fe-S cluster assembly protein SufD n=1 Tax=Methylocapsa sp. S129 TaxID=1641869 RepID=UPI00131CACA8|nr:Fe-S cluster assembly protein SufD [Methylocapsa sp. S129]
MTLHALKTRTAAETALAEQFAAGQGALSALDREASFRLFAAKGLPTRRDEAWHYTDLRSLFASVAPLANAPDAAAIAAARKTLAARARAGATTLAIVDGRYISELSDPPPQGVSVAALTQTGRGGNGDADPLLALNGALAQGGCVVTVDAGADVTKRIEIVHLMTDGAAKSVHSRVAIDIGAGARARIVESFVGADAGDQRDAATLIDLTDGAKLDHAVIVEDNAALHIESQTARLGDKAELSAFGFVAGGALVRRQIFATLTGQNARIALGGLSLLNGKRHADTTLVVDHAAPHGQSREFYKHIVADDATGVYQGKVVVQPGAQKTDGAMKSQAILLSPHAVMNNKPELEIFADDVVCGHGATVGALDPEQTFYLQARGLPKAEAEAMLLEAFGADAIARVNDQELAELLREKMRAWLARRTEGARR